MVGMEETTRSRIIRAATEVFSKYGYEQTSQKELARVVGISAAGLYKHFATKRDILEALIDLLVKNLDSYRPSEEKWDVIIAQGSLDGVIEHIVYAFPGEDALFMARLLRICIMNAFTIKEICNLYHEYFMAGQCAYLANLIKKLVAAKLIQPLDELKMAAAINDAVNYRAFACAMFPDLESYIEYSKNFSYKDILDFRGTVKSWLLEGTCRQIGLTTA